MRYPPLVDRKRIRSLIILPLHLAMMLYHFQTSRAWGWIDVKDGLFEFFVDLGHGLEGVVFENFLATHYSLRASKAQLPKNRCSSSTNLKCPSVQSLNLQNRTPTNPVCSNSLFNVCASHIHRCLLSPQIALTLSLSSACFKPNSVACINQ